MKAVVCCGGDFEVTELPDPTPGPGQVLLNISNAGICGSDVHLRAGLEHFANALGSTGADDITSPGAGMVFGHEFSGEVAEYGPGTHRRWKPGTLLVAMPVCRHGRTPHILGTSPSAPGAFAEQMVVQESVAFAVPNGLSAEHAALTEPMSVAWHAVKRSQIDKKQTAYVIGCGPIGLAVVGLLKAIGVETVVASDLSSKRRHLARQCGADTVINPQDCDPFKSDPLPRRSTRVAGMFDFPNVPWSTPAAPDDVNLALDTMEKLRRFSMVPWWQLFRAMYSMDRGPHGPVVFECVGLPGMLDRLVTDAPALSRIVVVGGCMGPDTFHPISALMKEVDLRFSVGYNPAEFRETLHMIAEGKIDPATFHTGTVGFSGVEAAFDALHQPEQHAKVLIDPRSSVSSL